MPGLLDELEVEVRIAEGHFLIEDEDVDWPITPAFSATEWLLVSDNQIAVCSASGEWHSPEALLQHWDSEPPAADSTWTTRSDAICQFASASLNIWNPAREQIFGSFDLGEPGPYHVRAYTADRDQTHRQLEEAAQSAGDQLIRGIEKFLIQFWPATAAEAAKAPHLSPGVLPEWLAGPANLERLAAERRRQSRAQ